MTEEEAEWCRRWLYGKPEYEIGFPGVLELVKEVRNHQTLTSFAVTSSCFSFGSSTTVGVVFSVESKEGGDFRILIYRHLFELLDSRCLETNFEY
ncbi:hypothetical protein YC2023_041134 [Brassica napus]